jgi:hypothetical protein
LAKLKTLLRKADERSTDAVWKRIGSLLDQFSSDECVLQKARPAKLSRSAFVGQPAKKTE